MFILYHVLTTLILIFFSPLFFLFRNKGRLKERLGLDLPNLGESGSDRLWVHALSVGEVLSAIPLLEALRHGCPSKELVLSVKTATGLEVAGKNLKGKIDYLLPMPLDFWWSARKMIRTIKPTIFILVETDIWPGLILSLKKGGIKTILVNGRVSPRTERSYMRWRFLIKRVLRLLELCLLQTEIDKHRFMSGGISPEKAKVTGNIKFDKTWRPLKDAERIRWLELLNLRNGLIWVAGSTHNPEEKIILSVFGHLLKSIPHLSLIIGPREAHRFNEVYELAKKTGFKVVRRSELPAEKQKYDVFILDTLGELGQVYGLADVAFVGGSLAPIGGHNLLEPASFGVPVLFGPHTHNFATMSRLMIKGGGGKMVTDESELLHVMLELLGNKSEREKIGKRAQEFVTQNQGALDRVMEILKPYIQGQ
ncbi:MAG: 3-deoxy-D-manno-octulosonic acid transferase [Desulfatiglandales bacterium]